MGLGERFSTARRRASELGSSAKQRASELGNKLADKVKQLKLRPGSAEGRGGNAKRVVRLGRLPTVVYADGSEARGVAAEGLYGLARLTVHEAEIYELPSSGSSGDLAGSTGGGGGGSSRRNAKHYAVVSVGRQTFSSKRVRRAPKPARSVALSPAALKAGGGGAVLPSAAAAEAAQRAGEGASRFVWDAGADVVLQRAGASLAQVAVYRVGRVRGALGDTLQCWAKIDLASYFAPAGAEAAGCTEQELADDACSAPAAGAQAGAAAGDLAVEQAQEQMQPPPTHLLTLQMSDTGSSMALSYEAVEELGEQSAHSSGEEEGAAAEQRQQQRQAGEGSAAGGGGAADSLRPLRVPLTRQQRQQQQQQQRQVLDDVPPSPLAADAPAVQLPGLARMSSSAVGSDEGGTDGPAAGGGGSGHGVLEDVWLPLVDPADPKQVRGRVRMSVRTASPAGLEQQLWRRLLALADLDGNGTLQLDEFASLLEAMGSDLSPEEVSALFAAADANGDGTVDADELAAALTACHEEGGFSRLMRRCPVDGAELLPNDDVANVIYVTLALDEGTSDSLRGGYTTPEQVSRSWLLSMTEWATQGLAGDVKALWKGNQYHAGGLRRGAAAAHILVFDRASKRVVEEALSPSLALTMRALYQSAAGRLLLREGACRKLRKMSEKYGAYADSPESAADIPKFLAAFKGQVDMQEALEPSPAAYPTFNTFFYRKLKPSARPIAAADDPGVIVSAADCRLTVFASVDDATRCWIKGRRFSLAGLLADEAAGADFEGGGSMAIFRLAPQDYHRFHLPVGGRVESITDVPGELLTVNPIAVNSTFADVFTRNKRSILRLQCPGYGSVAYVAIGATVVGSIIWTAEVGQELPKGAEAGFFSFGGSTLVVLFQAGAATWDEDLRQNSLSSLETRVLMGERLGRRGARAAGAGPSDAAPEVAAVGAAP